jgi:protein SERAC1
MFTLEDKPPDATKMIDIVAVHGLNGHFLRTWPARGPDWAQIYWLRDFLPKQIPNARIMSYGYNSALLFSKSVADIFTFDQLLEALISRRVTEIEQKRPNMFSCHSLGGIVFKQASRL